MEDKILEEVQILEEEDAACKKEDFVGDDTEEVNIEDLELADESEMSFSYLEEENTQEAFSEELVLEDVPDDISGEMNENFPKTEVEVVGVRFRTAGKSYYFAVGDLPVKRGSHVIVETSRGLEYGTSVCDPMVIDRRKFKAPVKQIMRIATLSDENRVRENREKEREAYRVCFEKIRRHNLDMKLIDAEYTFDNSKILFYFTSDGRVDFRDLVKDLAGVFHTRIELRQIGVRDETKILGGYGICGRALCCHTYLSDFVPVSIKMAKEQNLSLNPTKISGTCGRLMCCLKNEEETYEELNKNMPRLGDEVQGSDGLTGEVASVNILKQTVRILVEVDDEKELHEYSAEDITILRRRKRGQAKPKINRNEIREAGNVSHVRKEPAPVKEAAVKEAPVKEAAEEKSVVKDTKESHQQQLSSRLEHRSGRGKKAGAGHAEGQEKKDASVRGERSKGVRSGPNSGAKGIAGQGERRPQGTNTGRTRKTEGVPENAGNRSPKESAAGSGAPRNRHHRGRRRNSNDKRREEQASETQ